MTAALPVDQSRAEGLLGASDAPGALGLDKYNPPIKVWRRLRGLTVSDDKPPAVVEAARWGLILEPVVRGHYAVERGAAVYVPTKSLIHPALPWLRATPDGVVCEGGAAGATIEGMPPASAQPVGGLQVKTCSVYVGEQWEDGVPDHHEVQVRTEMAVTGLPWCDVVCLVGGQRLVGPFRVHRDLRLEENILRDLAAFWRLVESGTEPPVDGSGAWRDHAAAHMKGAPKAMAATETVEAVLSAWRAAKRDVARAELAADALRTTLLLRLSAAGATKIESLRFGTFGAYRPGARIDWKAYALSIGGKEDAAEAFRGEPGAWTLRAPRGFIEGE